MLIPAPESSVNESRMDTIMDENETVSSRSNGKMLNFKMLTKKVNPKLNITFDETKDGDNTHFPNLPNSTSNKNSAKVSHSEIMILG